MIKRRASLASLMALVALLAAGLAAMKVATDGASRVVFGLALIALLVSTLGAIVRNRCRAAWVGFALFGWGFALVLIVPPLEESVAAELPGRELLRDLVDVLQPPLSDPPEPAGDPPSTTLEKEGSSEWHYVNSSLIVDLSSEGARPWALYLDRRNAYDASVKATAAAKRIALTFLGLAFASLGAATGQALSDQSTHDPSSPGPDASTSHG